MRGVRVMLEKRLPLVATLDDLIALEDEDMKATGGRNSRMKLMEQAFRKAHGAGIPIVFGSGATSVRIPHGKQADQFAMVRQMGHDAGAGAADGLSAGRADAELRLGGRRRLDREGQVRRHHRGLGQSAPGHKPVTADMAESLGLKEAHGVIVSSVSSGSAAEHAGVKPGDILKLTTGSR